MRNVAFIGPIAYLIVEVSRLLDDNDVRLMGQIDYRKAIIKIDPDMDPDRAQVVVWHEILHGIIEQNGLIIPEETEEKFVQRLAFALVDFFQRNGLSGWRYNPEPE